MHVCIYTDTHVHASAIKTQRRETRHLGASVSLQHNTRAVLFTSVALAIFGLIKSIVQSWDKSQRGINNAHIRVHTAGGEGEGRAEPFVSLALSRATHNGWYIYCVAISPALTRRDSSNDRRYASFHFASRIVFSLFTIISIRIIKASRRYIYKRTQCRMQRVCIMSAARQGRACL